MSRTYIYEFFGFPPFGYSYSEATEEPAGDSAPTNEAMIGTVLSVSIFVGIGAVRLISLTLLAIALGVTKSDVAK